MEDGDVTRVKKVLRKPVEVYLKEQKRFRHLFKPNVNTSEIAKIQAIADKNAERYGIDLKIKKPDVSAGPLKDPGLYLFLLFPSHRQHVGCKQYERDDQPEIPEQIEE